LRRFIENWYHLTGLKQICRKSLKGEELEIQATFAARYAIASRNRGPFPQLWQKPPKFAPFGESVTKIVEAFGKS
jgi:hypothetical protein